MVYSLIILLGVPEAITYEMKSGVLSVSQILELILIMNVSLSRHFYWGIFENTGFVEEFKYIICFKM